MKVVTIAQQPENSSIWTPESVSFSSQGSTRTFRDPSQQKRVHQVLSEPLESHQRGFEPLTEGLQICDPNHVTLTCLPFWIMVIL